MTLSRRSITVLRRAVRFIKCHPDTLDMRSWVRHDSRIFGREPWCGTVACLAGTIALLKTGRRPNSIADVSTIALRTMGITSWHHREEIIQKLFSLFGWGEFHKQYLRASQKRKPAILAARVEHFIKTGE